MWAQGEAKRFLEALRRAALKAGDPALSMAAMYAVADAIELQGDVPGAIEMLNEAGAKRLWFHDSAVYVSPVMRSKSWKLGCVSGPSVA